MCDVGTVETIEIEEWRDLTKRQVQKQFVQLMNLCLKRCTSPLGMYYLSDEEVLYFKRRRSQMKILMCCRLVENLTRVCKIKNVARSVFALHVQSTSYASRLLLALSDSSGISGESGGRVVFGNKPHLSLYE